MDNEIKDWKYIESVIESEGFEYTFLNYDSFECIKDQIFHDKRLKYINAQKDLENYIKQMKTPQSC